MAAQKGHVDELSEKDEQSVDKKDDDESSVKEIKTNNIKIEDIAPEKEQDNSVKKNRLEKSLKFDSEYLKIPNNIVISIDKEEAEKTEAPDLDTQNGGTLNQNGGTLNQNGGTLNQNGGILKDVLGVPRNGPRMSFMEEESVKERMRVTLLKQCSAILKQGDQRYNKDSLHKTFQDEIDGLGTIHNILTYCNRLFAAEGLGYVIHFWGSLTFACGMLQYACSFVLFVSLLKEDPLTKLYIIVTFTNQILQLAFYLWAIVRLYTANSVCTNIIVVQKYENGTMKKLPTSFRNVASHYIYQFFFHGLICGAVMIYFVLVVNSFAIERESGTKPEPVLAPPKPPPPTERKIKLYYHDNEKDGKNKQTKVIQVSTPPQTKPRVLQVFQGVAEPREKALIIRNDG